MKRPGQTPLGGGAFRQAWLWPPWHVHKNIGARRDHRCLHHCRSSTNATVGLSFHFLFFHNLWTSSWDSPPLEAPSSLTLSNPPTCDWEPQLWTSRCWSFDTLYSVSDILVLVQLTGNHSVYGFHSLGKTLWMACCESLCREYQPLSEPLAALDWDCWGWPPCWRPASHCVYMCGVRMPTYKQH